MKKYDTTSVIEFMAPIPHFPLFDSILEQIILINISNYSQPFHLGISRTDRESSLLHVL